eukprot:jgi/Undpi1/10304/HiC_scaffold_28.g12755.m1
MNPDNNPPVSFPYDHTWWHRFGGHPALNTPRVRQVRRDTAESRRAAMLRAKSIPAFLEQANTDGMRATMLLQADGALQGSAGEGIDEIREQIMGVVSTAMWGEFNGAGMRIAMPKQYY